MHDSGEWAREKLLRWLLDLLNRPQDCWTQAQRAFIESLLEGHEGTKTLAELAITSARIRLSGLKLENMGRLRPAHEAIEAFWNNPCNETYENLRTAGRSLDTDA